MPKPNKFRPYVPNSEFTDLLGSYSGAEINGVGDPHSRRPKMVWWAPEPDAVVFGPAQKWFYGQERPDAEMLELRAKRRDILDAPLPEVALSQVSLDPSEWTSGLQNFVDAGDCEMVGVTALQTDWVYEDQQASFKNVVMLGVQHDYEELKFVPETRGGKDVTRQYCRAAAVAKKVAGWLRQQGWDAKPVTGPMTGEILMIPPAIECGFGELGKHGSLINPEFGSAFRLGAVLTDAPFAYTTKRTFGVDEFCSNCRVCEDACPPLAISADKQLVRGAKKWYVDFDACIPFFAETSGCAICIAVCPWSRPGVGLNLAAKLAKREARKTR